MKCPKCGEEMTQETVDAGVCSVPCGPLGCENCGYVEPRVCEDDDDFEPPTVNNEEF